LLKIGRVNITEARMPILRFAKVQKRMGLSRSTIWRLEREELFVRRVQLSPNAVGWVEEEVDEWILSRMAGRARSADGEPRSIADVISAAPSTDAGARAGRTLRKGVFS
jgi:prophage regulatory protein